MNLYCFRKLKVGDEIEIADNLFKGLFLPERITIIKLRKDSSGNDCADIDYGLYVLPYQIVRKIEK